LARPTGGRAATAPFDPIAYGDGYPHLHIVDGVTITHAHVGGDLPHEHDTITVSMEHYVRLVKLAQRQQSS
jgi:hypothetical protein